MHGRKVNENTVDFLIENASWGEFGLTMGDAEVKTDVNESKEKAEKVDEECDAPVCPVCLSQLSEFMDDEQLFERVNSVLEAFNEEYADEDEDEVEEDEDEEEYEEDEEGEEEEVEEED